MITVNKLMELLFKITTLKFLSLFFYSIITKLRNVILSIIKKSVY